jgi:hypothetical protein
VKWNNNNMTTSQVFISYAHADDQTFDEDVKGWVTNFVDKLQKAIGMKPGGSEVKCWMDHRLEPQREVDETLRQRIRDSQCILAFMSPRYLESEWCQKEMATFVELVGGGKANNRVFLVELLPTERGDWHKGLRSITAIKFWDDAIDQPEPMTLGWPVPNLRPMRPRRKRIVANFPFSAGTRQTSTWTASPTPMSKPCWPPLRLWTLRPFAKRS